MPILPLAPKMMVHVACTVAGVSLVRVVMEARGLNVTMRGLCWTRRFLWMLTSYASMALQNLLTDVCRDLVQMARKLQDNDPADLHREVSLVPFPSLFFEIHVIHVFC